MSIKVRRFLFLYLSVLPIAIVDRCGIITPFLTIIVAYPLLSLGYVINAFAAWYLFGESLTALRLAGIGFIVVGVCCVVRT